MSAMGAEPKWKAIEDRHGLGVYAKRPIQLVRGRGARVWDAEGREYIDCVTGVGVALVGHAHPKVVAAIAEQARTLITAYELFYNDARARFLEKLAGALPSGLDRYFLCNSGAEAVEGAMKLARVVTGRPGLVAAMRGYHGKTLGALSATWDRAYRAPVEPLLPSVRHAPFNNAEKFAAAIDEATAGVLLEVVQGEGGVRPAEPAFLEAVAGRCREAGALLIIDEVQTGCGRTGRFLALEHFGLEPDLVCLAKAVGGGVPIGVVAAGKRVRDLPRRIHSSTFGGNPLACAAAHAALEVIEEEGLVARAGALGKRFRDRILADLPAVIREVRGPGLMIGIELKQKAGRFLEPLAERGVLALLAGNSVLRLLPPLVISEDDLDRVADRVTEVLHDASGE